MHSEALASTNGVEECLFLQTLLHELAAPTLTAYQLLDVPSEQLIPIIATTDCNDLYEVLISPAFPMPTNKALTLYLAALREQKEIGRVIAWVWQDTRDCLPNALTKLNSDGTLPCDDYCESTAHGFWEPRYPFRWNGMLSYPTARIADAPIITLNAPPTPVKVQSEISKANEERVSKFRRS